MPARIIESVDHSWHFEPSLGLDVKTHGYVVLECSCGKHLEVLFGCEEKCECGRYYNTAGQELV